MKTVFDVLTTIKGTSIMCIFSLLQKKKPAKMTTHKEKTGLQTMYNLDKTYLKTFPYSSVSKRGQ